MEKAVLPTSSVGVAPTSTIASKESRNRTNVPQSVIDLIVSVNYVLHIYQSVTDLIVSGVAFLSFSWAFGYYLCKSVHYFQIVAMVCSVMTLTVMSIERNIAILSPLRSKRICTRRRARVAVVFLWLGSLILALPILFAQQHKEVGNLYKAFWCKKEWDKPIHGILFESYMLVLLFMVPVCVMVVSYTTICLELAKGSKFWRQTTADQSRSLCVNHTNHSNHSNHTYSASLTQTNACVDNRMLNRHKERMDKEKMKVIRMLIVVVVLFAFCWGPILINNLLVALGVLPDLHYGVLKPLRMTMFVLSYINSSLNPLVYGFMSRHFRRGFREAICICYLKSSRRGAENRLYRATRGNNMSCYYASESRASTIRTGTIRLSPVTEQIRVDEDMGESPVGSVRYGRKVWARTERVPHNLHDD
ncbi:galanin receptor type 1-like [Physella acuta]|uniref:galanin receptor type 1-like n=1 Tax=Physella acuta TaxID=109671 RepID=UPI0027DD9BD3|nr:galanin receptor type 1-like [Physella acuta]